MKKVLMVTDVNFWERCSGNRTRISALIDYLASHVQLTVLNTGPAPHHIENLLSGQYPADFFVLHHTDQLSSEEYGQLFAMFMKDKEFDTIIIEYIHCSYFLNYLTYDITAILDAHDIISDRAEEFARFNYGGTFYEMDAKDEAEIFGVYDKIMVLTQPDLEKVNALTGGDKALMCAHPVIPKPAGIKRDVKNIAFVASGYLPNVDSINFFMEYCWEEIAAANDVNLLIYGSVCGRIDLPEDPRVIKKGVVANTDRIYKEADIVINPVRFGAGLKIKNVEAMSYGLPLVTTTHGTRGIEKGIGNAFLVADTPNDFTEAVSLLISDLQLRKNLSANALRFVEEDFSVQQCFEPLLQEINTHLQEINQ